MTNTLSHHSGKLSSASKTLKKPEGSFRIQEILDTIGFMGISSLLSTYSPHLSYTDRQKIVTYLKASIPHSVKNDVETQLETCAINCPYEEIILCIGSATNDPFVQLAIAKNKNCPLSIQEDILTKLYKKIEKGEIHDSIRESILSSLVYHPNTPLEVIKKISFLSCDEHTQSIALSRMGDLLSYFDRKE